MKTEERRSDFPCIYIHGTGPHPSRRIWKSQWDLALFGRPMGKRTIGAYWADILHADQTAGEKISTDRERDSISTDRILETAGLRPDNEAAAEFVSRLMARLDLYGESIREARSSPSLSPGRQWHGRMAESFLRQFVSDSAAYFFRSGVRRRIQERLKRRIERLDTSFVLVSHGLGSVIAHEVISQMSRKPKQVISLLVTLGSPLGIREIQEELMPEGGPIRVPDGIAMWHNFADRLDPIALDHQLANDLTAETSDAIEIQDHQILKRSVWSLANLNPHDSAGYLSHPEVRSIVHQMMRFDSTGRFVVARDVAHGFAARDIRQPVLIEVLEWKYPAVEESREKRIARESSQRKRDRRLQTLSGRIKHLARQVKRVVEHHADEGKVEEEVNAARVLSLRKYVSAHLTPTEIQALAAKHADLNIYAMWRSSRKKKLIHRSHRAIGADAARASFNSMGDSITWAVLDTGCRFDHPHFRLRRGVAIETFDQSLIVDVLDCTTTSQEPVSIVDPWESDPDGHGTHVCGIITGRGKDKQYQYEGVAPRTRLLVYKVLNDHGFGEDAWIIKAIDDIFRRNDNNSDIAVHGVNLSLGGPFDATVYGCGFSPICKELRDLWRQGTIVCVAAGNEGQIQVSTQDGPFDLNTALSIGDPANLEDCIAVGSVNTDKPYLHGISHFSSRGPTTDGRVKPDVVAPGERIRSCSNDFNGKLYREFSGTSMACPHVSGMLAAFLSVRREFIGRPDEVKEILLSNCNDLGRDRRHQGHGIPNLLKMLTET